VTPATVQSGDAVVRLDLLLALVALARRVALHPVVRQLVMGARRLDVSGNAGGRRALDATLVNGELADCGKSKKRVSQYDREPRTCAGEAFAAHAGQHVQAEVAIGGLAEVFQSPEVISVLANGLKQKRIDDIEIFSFKFSSLPTHVQLFPFFAKVSPLLPKVCSSPREREKDYPRRVNSRGEGA